MFAVLARARSGHDVTMLLVLVRSWPRPYAHTRPCSAAVCHGPLTPTSIDARVFGAGLVRAGTSPGKRTFRPRRLQRQTRSRGHGAAGSRASGAHTHVGANPDHVYVLATMVVRNHVLVLALGSVRGREPILLPPSPTGSCLHARVRTRARARAPAAARWTGSDVLRVAQRPTWFTKRVDEPDALGLARNVTAHFRRRLWNAANELERAVAHRWHRRCTTAEGVRTRLGGTACVRSRH